MSARCYIRAMPPCPTCTKPANAPFCSERCRQVDLNRWFTGAYAVPAVELDDVDFEEAEAASKPSESDDFGA